MPGHRGIILKLSWTAFLDTIYKKRIQLFLFETTVEDSLCSWMLSVICCIPVTSDFMVMYLLLTFSDIAAISGFGANEDPNLGRELC